MLPLGVILTKPVAVTPFGDGVGVFAGAPDMHGALSPLILGTPPKHDVLKEILNIVVRMELF